MPKWQEDLVEHFGIGLDPEALRAACRTIVGRLEGLFGGRL